MAHADKEKVTSSPLHWILAPLVLLTVGCIDPFEVSTEHNDPTLTVNGILTTQPGQSSVRLNYTTRYGGVFEGVYTPVEGATVVVRNTQGEVVYFEDVLDTIQTSFFDRLLLHWVTNEFTRSKGLYRPPEGFQACVGETYTLLVSMADGKSYTSLPEQVLPAIPINGVTVQPLRIFTTNPLLDRYAVRLSVDVDDPANVRNNYLWTGDYSTYEYISNPELALNGLNHPSCPKCPNPKECCRLCYIEDIPLVKNFEVTTDQFFDGLSTTLPTLTIANDGQRFKGKYRLRLNQFAISDRAYTYFQLMNTQLSIEGSVFDPLPANIRGNMIDLIDPTTQVLGYFVVADVASEIVYIDGEKIPLNMRPVPFLIPNDCRIEPGTTTVMPTGWGQE